jgi:hypothetical protein
MYVHETGVDGWTHGGATGEFEWQDRRNWLRDQGIKVSDQGKSGCWLEGTQWARLKRGSSLE